MFPLLLVWNPCENIAASSFLEIHGCAFYSPVLAMLFMLFQIYNLGTAHDQPSLAVAILV